MSPRRLGWRPAPAWSRPGRFWMSWPAASGDRERDDLAREDALGLAQLLSDHAPVTIFVHPQDVAECALRTPPGVSALAALHHGRPVGQLAPRWLVDGTGAVVAAVAGDDGLSRQMAEACGVAAVAAPAGLDLSAMDCDGEGTALASDRLAAGLAGGRYEAEQILSDWLGIEQVIWLDDVNGRLPGRFLAPGLVALPIGRDERQPGQAALVANRDRLSGSVDAVGRPVGVVELPCPRRQGGCYADMVVAGRLVVVPAFEDRQDDGALARLAESLPDCRAVAYPATYLLPEQGGGLGMVVAVSPAGHAE